MDWFTDEIAATYRPLTLVKWICWWANIAVMQILCSPGFKVQEGRITLLVSFRCFHWRFQLKMSPVL